MTNAGGSKRLAVLIDNGTRMIMKPVIASWIEMEELYLISGEELDKLVQSGDHVEAMSCPYKLQPDNPGKFIWISGPPGTGKSTSAQLLSRNNGFVYYEADCVMNHANPYIPSDVENPSMSQLHQKHLKVTQSAYIRI